MVQQTSSPHEGANYRRLGRRIATTTVLGVLTLTGTVAAQSDGTGNALGQFFTAFGQEFYPTLILGLFVFIPIVLILSGFPFMPTAVKKALRTSAGGGAAVLALALIAPELLQTIIGLAGYDIEISVWGFIVLPLAL